MSRPNILYITIDSIRADHVGYQGYDRETTPTLDRIAERGTVCTHTFASGIPTYYSFKSLLAGIPSLGQSTDIGVPGETSTLAEILKDAGYTTAGFNAGNPWLTREYGYHRGFDTFRDFLTDDPDSDTVLSNYFESFKRRVREVAEGNEFLRDKAGFSARLFCALTDRTPLESAETVTETALDWLADHSQSQQPFFLWIHYMDPHYPWVPPERYRQGTRAEELSTFEMARLWHHASHMNSTESSVKQISADDVRKINGLYDAEIRRTDAAIGRVIDHIKRQGSLEDTFVAITGDHGTELYDHGAFSHGPRTLYNEVIRVPLVITGPTVPDQSVSTITSLIDLPTSILERLRIDSNGFGDFGTSVFESQRERAFTEVIYDIEPVSGTNRDNGILASCIEWPWKLIVNEELETRELYHLEDDPREQEDLVAEFPNRAEELAEALAEFRRRVERHNNTVHEKSRLRSRIDELKQRGEI